MARQSVSQPLSETLLSNLRPDCLDKKLVIQPISLSDNQSVKSVIHSVIVSTLCLVGSLRGPCPNDFIRPGHKSGAALRIGDGGMVLGDGSWGGDGGEKMKVNEGNFGRARSDPELDSVFPSPLVTLLPPMSS